MNMSTYDKSLAFYRAFEQAIADKLPSGKSDYQKLTIRVDGKRQTIWQVMQRNIAVEISNWPQWSAAIQQHNAPENGGTDFSRYGKNSPRVPAPKTFQDLNQAFDASTLQLHKQTVTYIKKAITAGIKRFEKHPDYQKAVADLQKVLSLKKLQANTDALPILDAIEPSRLTDEVIAHIRERLSSEIQATKKISYPYDAFKPFVMNAPFIMRVQVQLKNTYGDRISRLIGAAERQYVTLFRNEILKGEIAPLIRNLLNDKAFLQKMRRVPKKR